MFPFHLKHRVAYLNVYSEIAFHSSVDHWRASKSDCRGTWQKIREQVEAISIDEDAGIELDGDCVHPISVDSGGVVHINGDLISSLRLGGHHEVVIRGNVSQGATIIASGFHRLYVGGSMSGQLQSTDGAKIWVEGDFIGSLETGTPATSVNIGGDYRGSIAPYKEAALLWMTVGGFASYELMSVISGYDYTVFDASIGHSDVEAGFYPTTDNGRNTESGRCTTNWTVGTRGNP